MESINWTSHWLTYQRLCNSFSHFLCVKHAAWEFRFDKKLRLWISFDRKLKHENIIYVVFRSETGCKREIDLVLSLFHLLLFFFLTFSYGITLPTVKFVTFSWRLLRDTRFIEGTKEEIFTRWKLSRTTFTSQMWNIYFGYLSVVSLSTCQSWNADATGQFIQ